MKRIGYVVMTIAVFFMLSFPITLFAFDNILLTSPKSALSQFTTHYNFTYGIYEIETKISKYQDLFAFSPFTFGIYGGVTMYIHPPADVFGYFPVDNLYGVCGVYAKIPLVNNFNLIMYPVIHESAHLVDGYEKGNIYDDYRTVSNEFIGFDLDYPIKNLIIYTGFLYYINTNSRDLICRLHIGEDCFVDIASLRFIMSSDFALFYESELHYAVNVATGIDLKVTKLLLFYENQNGLGQDFDVRHVRFGIKYVFD